MFMTQNIETTNAKPNQRDAAVEPYAGRPRLRVGGADITRSPFCSCDYSILEGAEVKYSTWVHFEHAMP
jgi:hypothetical protein